MATIEALDLVHDAELWAAVHRDIQHHLSALDSGLESSNRQWEVSEGRTCGTGFVLFSYRTYCDKGFPYFDPIVAGVLFRLSSGDFTVRGDISREETGIVLVEVQTRLVKADRSAILLAARQISQQLAQSVDGISDLVQDSLP